MKLSKKSKVLLPTLLAFVLVFSMIGAYADTPLPEETNTDAAVTEQDIVLEDYSSGGGADSQIDSEEDSTIADESLAVEEPEAIEEPAEEPPVQGPIQIEGLSEISTLGIEDEEEDTPIVNALATPDATVTTESGVGTGLNEAIAAAPTDGSLYTIAVDAPINITGPLTGTPGATGKAIVAGKNIVITSTAPANQLTRSTAGPAFTISGGGKLTLENIILNGYSSNTSALITFGTNGGEFNLESDATIQNNTTTSNGGAIFAQNLPNIVININGATIKKNTAANGGAIYVIGNNLANQVTLNIRSGAKFIENIAGGAATGRQGGAINFGNYVTTTISGSTFRDNTAYGNGGAISGTGAASSFSMTNSIVRDNHAIPTGAVNGGGVYLNNLDTATISGSSFSYNESKPNVGGNYAASGGGLWLTASATTSTTAIANTSFIYNEAISQGTSSGNGGGLYVNSVSLVSLPSITAANNKVLNSDETKGVGGGIWVGVNASFNTISNATITNNYSGQYGGGAYLSGISQATISGSTITHNHAITSFGGGISLATAGTDGAQRSLTLSGTTTVSNNEAGTTGGGINGVNYLNLTLKDSATINNNTAGINGGGVNTGTANHLVLEGSATINNNTAGTNGGGVVMGTNGTTTAPSLTMNENAEIIGNTAAQERAGQCGGILIGHAVAGYRTQVELSGDAKINNNYAGYKADGTTPTGFTGNYGGISIGNFADVTLAGNAQINGNKAATSYGGLAIGTGSTFLMDADTSVSNNEAGTSFGGISLGGTNGTTAPSFTMKGNAKVTGNLSAQKTNGSYGGITVGAGSANDRAIVEISDDAKINNNYTGYKADGTTPTGFTGNYGGIGIGRYADVTMINRAQIDWNKAYGSCGGINFAGDGTFIMDGNTSISYNEARGTAAGFRMVGAKFVDISGDAKLNYNNGIPGTGAFGAAVIGVGNDGEVNLHGNVEIAYNTSSRAAGFATNEGTNSTTNIYGSVRIHDNTAATSNMGGANVSTEFVHIYGDVEIYNNYAETFGAGLSADHPTDANVEISGDVKIYDNVSGTDGAGFYVMYPNTLLTVKDNVEITGNTASGDGGGIYMPGDLANLDVGEDVTLSGNTAGTYAQGVLPADIATYGAHILKANSTWSNSPSTGVSFLRGYNNYDINYNIPGIDKHTVKFVLTGEDDVVRTTEYNNIYDGTHWGDVIVVPNTTSSAHYSFNGWSENIPADDFAIDGDKTYTGSFKIDSHLVRYFANNGSGATYLTMLYTHGQAGVTVKDAGSLVREGYTFKGWATTANTTAVGYAPGALLNIENDVELYAVWEKNDEPVIVTPPPTPDVEDPEVTTPITTTPDADNPAVATAEATPPTAPATTTDVDGGNNEAVGTVNTPVDTPANDGQTTNPLEELSNGNVPLGGLGMLGGWSLVSLIFSMVAVVIAALLIISRRRREDEEYRYAGDEELTEKKRSRLLKIITIAAGFLTLIVWLVLDNFSEQMIWINRNTLYVGIVLLITLTSLVVYKIRKSDKDGEYAAE